MNANFDDYRLLLAKASAKFSEIQMRHAGEMNCGRGCHLGCAPGLSVFAVERANMLEHIHATPGLSEKLTELECTNPYQGERCSFLNEVGECTVYEARPLICRTHGAPIFYRDETDADSGEIDACRLNFDGGAALKLLSADDLINLDLLNQLLTLVNRHFETAGATDNEAGKRWPLSFSGLS